MDKDGECDNLRDHFALRHFDKKINGSCEVAKAASHLRML